MTIPDGYVFHKKKKDESKEETVLVKAPPAARKKKQHVDKKKPSTLTMFHHAYLASLVSSTGVGHMPCGQLDVNTTGLMLFTDDARVLRGFCKKGQCQKVYVVGWDKPEGIPGLTSEERRVLETGFETVGDCVLKGPLLLEEPNDRRPKGCRRKQRWTVEVSISTGQNHIVKRNFFAAKIAVKTLERTKVGGIFVLGGWKPATFRKCEEWEVREFCKEIGVDLQEDLGDKGERKKLRLE